MILLECFYILTIRMSFFPKYLKLHFLLLLLLPFLAGFGQDLGNLKDQKPFAIKGSLGGTLMFYDVEGREANRQPFVWMLTGSPTVSIYGIQFPFSFVVSEQQRDFRQPFNKFGVSPYYKWARLHLGYRNLNWSPYTLAGHTIFGAGAELNPGKWQTGIIYGRLLRAVEPGELSYETNDSYLQTPSFSRKALSMKVGYGTDKNNAGIIMFKGWDDPESLAGESIPAFLMPEENFIISFYTHQEIVKNLIFDLQLAQSLYTNNRSSDEADSTDYGFMNIFSGLYNTNSSSYSSPALESSLAYNGKQASMAVKYKRIAPGFKSMGAYFFQNDLQNITLEPSFRFGDQKYNLSGSIGFQRDNLENDLPNTTHRTIGSLNFTATPANFYNINFSYSNYDLGQSKGMTSIDSLYEISQTTQNVSLNQNMNFTGDNFSQNIMLIFNYQKLKDKNDLTANFSSYTSTMLMGNYMFSLVNIGLTGSIGYNFTLFSLQASENKISGPVISLSKTLLDKKLNLTIADNYFRNEIKYTSGAENRVSGTNRISIRAGFRFEKKHRINFKLYIRDSKAKTSNFTPFSERKGDIGYVYTF
jgi:hypothetical protein